ncbi:methyl-accepting chemotaxis protein [Serpentinicella sp. ANB-PHB4]|uniref:methyl-accepting chemotaxis protein n=1 Tax=Serpentinicella sp. ANB-PHB4 TaxID=3074076 RepID=UPI0028646192|nr:methyl-accepting chemotaxis protein [Serpentinicella sp. ANB-PHB4]MDR5658573.1 methyl-accepting chemotaxis protein [Serpentinicella sp. ANB-PHB4]
MNKINEYRESFKLLVPFFSEMMSGAMIGINDLEQALEFYDGKKFHDMSDFPLDKKSAAYECIHNKETVKKIVNLEEHNLTYKAIGIPILEDDNVIGSFGVRVDVKNSSDIEELTNNLSSSLQEASQVVTSIASGTREAVKVNDDIVGALKETVNLAANTDDILQFINSIAGNTNLLGLNASIEAAKAGEAGRGFSVVATEIRKLSLSSKESTDKIRDILEDIKKSIESIESKVEDNNMAFADQASSLEQLSSAVEDITINSKALEELASDWKNN